jgi:hypothetical protein
MNGLTEASKELNLDVLENSLVCAIFFQSSLHKKKLALNILVFSALNCLENQIHYFKREHGIDDTNFLN